MNYGYATDDPLLGALEEDKVERYPLQMYRRLVASLPVALGVAGGTQLALPGQFTSPWLRKLAAFVTETGV